VSATRRGKPGGRFYALLALIAVLGMGALGYAATRGGTGDAAPRAVATSWGAPTRR
jgi:hypothetical protein